MKICLFVCMFLLYGCMDRAIDNRDVKVVNKSEGVVYCLMSDSKSFTMPYVEYEEEVFDKLHKIDTDTFLLVDDKPVNWEEYVEGCQDSKVRFFIIAKDSVDKYGWKEILTKSIYTKVFLLDINNLEQRRWQIDYNGD